MDVYADYMARAADPTVDIMGHLHLLYAYAREAGHVLELGVREGNSTAALLAGVDAGGGHLVSVDVSTPNVPAAWWRHPSWTFVQANSLTVDLGDAFFDVIFLDTDHRYRHTFDELVRLTPFLAPDGVFICHDTSLHCSHDPSDVAFPVRAALEDFCVAERGWGVTFLPGWFGLGLLRRDNPF